MNPKKILLLLLVLLMLSPRLTAGEEIYKTYYEDTALPAPKYYKPPIQWEEINIEATAYCSCKYCTGWGKNITASGLVPSRGTIAAPKHIPFGTVIKLDGLGEFVVQDRGGGIKVKDGIIFVDVWFPSHQEAVDFGRKKNLKGWIKVE